MSTTSRVTASAACNCITGDQVELLNCMCVLVLTRNDGTPFNAASIWKEDIIELCDQLGQTYPEDVLWYLVAELVVLFHSMEKMWVTVHGVIKATALCKEHIRLRTTPHFTTHVRAYIVVRDGETSGTQPLTLEREEELQSSPSDPHLDGRTPCQFQMDLGDTQLKQLMEDLCREVALRELNVPQGPTANPLGKSSGKQGSQCG